MPRKKKTEDVEEQEQQGLDEEAFQAHIRKDHEAGVIQYGNNLEDPDSNLSGSLALDIDLRIPFPAGRIIEVLGEEGSGKTSLILEILGQAQLRGKRTAYNNAERNLDRSLVDSIRTLDPSKLMILEGNNGEENLQLVRKFVANFPDSVIAVDSVDGIVPEAILEGDIGDSTMGVLARLMSDACRKLKEVCAMNKSTVIFINQMREQMNAYGDPRKPSGGRALKYYSSQRLRLEAVNKADQIKDEKGRVIGHNARYFILKNKAAPPFFGGSFPLMYGKGIYREFEVAKILKDLGIIDTGGPGGCLLHMEVSAGNKKFLSVAKAASLFESDPDLYKKYYDMVMDKFK